MGSLVLGCSPINHIVSAYRQRNLPIDGIVMEASVLYPVIAVERRQFPFYIISIVYGTVCIAWHNCKNAGKRALAAVGVADAHSH